MSVREFPKYDAYKDSGVEWIGKMPTHWEVRRIADVAVQNKTKNTGMVEDNLLSLSYGKIVRKDFNTSFGLLPESFETYQVVYPDIIIMRLTDLQNDKKSLRVGLVREQGIITSAYLGLYFGRSMYANFAYYLLHAYDICKIFYWFGGGLRSTMRYDDLKVIPFIVPPLNEQRTIANYLDIKTTQIDRKIELLTKKAAKYGELKQSLINETVTRGLDKTVAMKDSGVEWIGEVPEHWSIRRVKDIAKSINGGAFKDDLAETGVPIIKIQQLTLNCAATDFCDPKSQKIKFGNMLTSGDLVFSWSTLIAPFIYRGEDALLNQHIFKIVHSEQIHRSWLFYKLTQSSRRLRASAHGSTMQHILKSDFDNLEIETPPFFEQRDIADYLDTKTAQIDSIIETINTQIDKLRELRKTLINEVVTGKIKVV